MTAQERESLLERIAAHAEDVPEIQTALTACRAVGPENGGHGEGAKAGLIEKWLRDMGISGIKHVDAPDGRVPGGKRPNLIATIPGRSSRSLWLFAHMDVVPEGDPALWNTDPWKVTRKGDMLYGRGVEDNQQGLTSMLLLARALTEAGATPELTVKLVFMSDEECGNTKGLGYMLGTRPELFPKDDLYIVPDGGSPDGSLIEVAEKSIFWMKVTVSGVQCHASTPQKGVNALVGAADVLLALTGLAKDFSQSNPLFDPPKNTFVPTRHLENVAGVNILPGKDVFFMDCRLLPGLSPDDVIRRARERAGVAGGRRGVKVDIEQAMLTPASETSPDVPCAMALSRALRETGLEPKPVGIGGGTVAALLR
ncbi:MAG TPA: diaminopimelate aminotransferase, partial [Desulfovibrio sp.]|nr:diaminopimelate aminotransferase [Desulfovibrio sp.]